MYNYSTGEFFFQGFDFLACANCVVNGRYLFHSLLRRECCSFSNGEYVKAGLAELELWCAKATTEVIYIL